MRGSNRLANEIIKRIKDDLRNPANKIEGSLGSDNAQAVGNELARIYDYVDFVNEMHFIDTATGEWLDRKGQDFGLIRKEPTNANGYVTFKGKDGLKIPLGLLLYSDTLSFKVIEEGVVADGFVRLRCECTEPGAKGNVPPLAIYDFDKLQGLEDIESEEFSGGTDRESDDDFRERLLLKAAYPGTSGNCYHYMHWALEVEGVGRVKVYPIWDGPGTVKVSILDSNKRKAGPELMEKVKNHIGPDDKGVALAPVGADLTVSTAEEMAINISAKLTKRSGYDVDLAEVKGLIDDYFRSISYAGDPTAVAVDEELTIVSYARVIDCLMGLDGILDVIDLTLNGAKDSISLVGEEIPIVGEVEFV